MAEITEIRVPNDLLHLDLLDRIAPAVFESLPIDSERK